MNLEQNTQFSLFNAIVADINGKLLELIRKTLKELTFDFQTEYDFQDFVKSRVTILPAEIKNRPINEFSPQLQFLAILDYQTNDALQLFDCTFTVN